MGMANLGGQYQIHARHDYTDSVWDVWLNEFASSSGEWIPAGHWRVVADGKYDAYVEALMLAGESKQRAERLASDEREAY